MKALYYEKFEGPLEIREVPDPAMSEGSVVLKVLASGMCLSDWHGWKGHDPDITLPHVPGHELVGTIVEKGQQVDRFELGQRVTLPFVCGCGTCHTCNSGNPQVCPQQFQPGFTHWGSFAEFVEIKYANFNLVALPDSITSESAAILGCRFATSFRALVHIGQVKPQEYLVVFGCGGVGLSAVMIAKSKGAVVIAVDVKNVALSLARKLGASYTINANDSQDVIKEILEITHGGSHLNIDAIGNQEVLNTSLLCLARRGRHVQIGLFPSSGKMPTIAMDRMISYELSMHGSHGMQSSCYNEMLELIEKSEISPEFLIEENVSLEDAALILPSLHKRDGSGVVVINDF